MRYRFLDGITKSRIKIGPVLKKIHDIYFMKQRMQQAYTVKVIIICENNNSR